MIEDSEGDAHLRLPLKPLSVIGFGIGDEQPRTSKSGKSSVGGNFSCFKLPFHQSALPISDASLPPHQLPLTVINPSLEDKYKERQYSNQNRKPTLYILRLIVVATAGIYPMAPYDGLNYANDYWRKNKSGGH